MMVEIVGSLSDDWKDDIAQIAERVEHHPWGGPSFDVLLYGDLPALLQEHMPAERYRQWRRGYDEGSRIAITGGISFTTPEGSRAAAVMTLPDREAFLALAGHEAFEVALARRHDAEGHEFIDQTHTSLAHVLWSEYVVERARREVFEELGIGESMFDQVSVASQLDDLQAELPTLLEWAVMNDDVPQRLYQHWYEAARVYAMTLGRSDAGSLRAKDEIEHFRRRPLAVESAEGWGVLDDALRCAFDQPEAVAADLDEQVRNDGWMLTFEGLGQIWNPRYERALGQ